jgi:hypothetical protein
MSKARSHKAGPRPSVAVSERSASERWEGEGGQLDATPLLKTAIAVRGLKE